MLGASPISPCLPPSVGSPASGALRPPSTDVPPPSSGSWGSGSFSLTTAPRSRLPLAGARRRRSRRCCAHRFARTLAHDCPSLALVAAARGAAVPIGSLARSLTTAPRRRSSPPLAALPCPLVRSHARSQPAPGLHGRILGTVIGSVGGRRVMDGVRLEVLVELLVVLGRLLVGIGLPGVLRALPRPGQLRVGVPGALERLLELAGGVGDDVGDEGQRRDELDAGLPADRRP